MDEFEALLQKEKGAVERYVHFRIAIRQDAEDLLQEVYLNAYRHFDKLKNKAAFKPWLISIARNKCADYYRKKASQPEIPVEELEPLFMSRHGISAPTAVEDTLCLLNQNDRQILYLSFWQELKQAEIARQLGIPVGTVKSRLHAAKQHFKTHYPRITPPMKGNNVMKKLPDLLPEYTICPSSEPAFSVKWEELMGWFLVPKLGESLSWAMYDLPSRKCSHIFDMKVTGKAKVHGIEGVELTAREASYSNKADVTHRTFVAQLTDTHCRYLATLRTDGDVRNYITFLDGDEFMANWGFGEDNCGNEVNLSQKGDILRSGDQVTSVQKPFLLDIVGRYQVTIGGKTYDTVCVMAIETYNSGVVSEQYLDKNGRTILWRRFNRDDWAINRYKSRWSQLLPANQQIFINGVTYVHWYDCITDYIL